MTDTDHPPTGATTAEPFDHPVLSATHRRALIGSLTGSTIEWFDFFLYATAAALIFNKQFFPTQDETLSLMLSYFSLALTFFIRPLGGIIFSHIGDRVGRKKTLVVTLSLMGGTTVAIGLLPNYDTVGVLAPVLLLFLRLLQGLAIGGEWGGAMLLAYEYAPKDRRGLFGSVPQIGITAGLLLASLSLAGMSALPDEAFNAWGWRLPFVASIILIVIGLWIRGGLGETPAFKEAQEKGEIVEVPLFETLRHHWRAVLVSIGLKLADATPFYLGATFVVSYATVQLGFDRLHVLTAVSVAAAVSCVTIPLAGRLSDSIGRVNVYLLGALSVVVLAIPYYWALDSEHLWVLFAATVVLVGFAWAPITATLGTLTAEIFPADIRYTGVSLGYQIGAALAGGNRAPHRDVAAREVRRRVDAHRAVHDGRHRDRRALCSGRAQHPTVGLTSPRTPSEDVRPRTKEFRECPRTNVVRPKAATASRPMAPETDREETGDGQGVQECGGGRGGHPVRVLPRRRRLRDLRHPGGAHRRPAGAGRGRTGSGLEQRRRRRRGPGQAARGGPAAPRHRLVRG